MSEIYYLISLVTCHWNPCTFPFQQLIISKKPFHCPAVGKRKVRRVPGGVPCCLLGSWWIIFCSSAKSTNFQEHVYTSGMITGQPFSLPFSFYVWRAVESFLKNSSNMKKKRKEKLSGARYNSYMMGARVKGWHGANNPRLEVKDEEVKYSLDSSSFTRGELLAHSTHFLLSGFFLPFRFHWAAINFFIRETC